MHVTEGSIFTFHLLSILWISAGGDQRRHGIIGSGNTKVICCTSVAARRDSSDSTSWPCDRMITITVKSALHGFQVGHY